MKFQILTLAVTALAAVVNAAESTTHSGQTIKPTALIPAPPGVVCAMSVCPTDSAVLSKRDIACPTYCPNDCEIINDVCCPGHKKAVCKNNLTSSAVPSNSAPSASASASVSMPTSAPVVSMLPSASAQPSVSPAASPAAQSIATLNNVSMLSTLLLGSLLALGLTQL